MGSVYRARDTVLDRQVALKIPRGDYAADPQLAILFHHEARAGASLVHENICRVLDFGTLDGTAYLCMDYIHGNPLRTGQPWEPADALRMVRTLALALEVAHAQAVIHRDLKPGNILVTPEGRPVIMDFGLALRLNRADAQLPRPGEISGTLLYMPPEQAHPGEEPISPAADIYSLGVILYELLTGRVPFTARDLLTLIAQIVHEEPARPSALRPGLSAVLDTICLRALAKSPRDRFTCMREFAETLEWALAEGSAPAPPELPATAPQRPRVPPTAIAYAFTSFGDRAPPSTALRDRLYLDVGNDLRPGVIDHHHNVAAFGSSTRHVLLRPDLIDAVVNPERRPEDPFTLVVHRAPDLDCVGAAFLASAYLGGGRFPNGAELLACYVDGVDEGAVGMSLANPFSLYAAYRRLTARAAEDVTVGPAQWREWMRDGVYLVGYVLVHALRRGLALPEVDAFACERLFGPEDRRVVLEDAERYERKLADPRCQARQGVLRLPGRFGGREEVEALLVRDVHHEGDPERCLFFRDWARSDARRCRHGKGFVALCLFQSERARQKRRCVISVAPDSKASLRGLGELLDTAEAARRRAIHGEDDRVKDPVTGAACPPRPGYANADPWYDGRGHNYTIVDAPHGGTELTADEIEALFLEFGRG
jgi:serine/threonine protein kinase